MFRDVLSTYAARFAGLLAQIILLPLVLSHVGLSAYGVYTVTVAFVALFQQDLGVGNAMTRFVSIARGAEDWQTVQDFTDAANSLFTIVAAVAMLLSSVAFYILWPHLHIPSNLDREALSLAVMAVGGLGISLISSPYRQLLYSFGRMSRANGIQFSQQVVRILLTLIAVNLSASVVVVGLADLVAIVFGAAFLMVTVYKDSDVYTPKLGRMPMQAARELFSVSMYLLVISISGLLIVQFGSIASSIRFSAAVAGLFAGAQRVYFVVKEVTNSLSIAVLPRASESVGSGEVGVTADLYSRGTQLANMLMVALAVPLMGAMPFWLKAWAGAPMVAASSSAIVLILSLIANNNHLLAIPILTAHGKLGWFAILHATWAVSAIVLAFVFGSASGDAGSPIGVALGIAIPVLLLEPFYILVTLRVLRVPWISFLTRSILLPYLPGVLGIFGFFAVRRYVGLDTTSVLLSSALWIAICAPSFVFQLPERSRRWLVVSTKTLIPRRAR